MNELKNKFVRKSGFKTLATVSNKPMKIISPRRSIAQHETRTNMPIKNTLIIVDFLIRQLKVNNVHQTFTSLLLERCAQVLKNHLPRKVCGDP